MLSERDGTGVPPADIDAIGTSATPRPISIIRLEPVGYVVEAARRLLAEAETGTLRGLTYVAKYPDETRTQITGEVDARDLALALLDMQEELAARRRNE
jgi:hypothetical protein